MFRDRVCREGQGCSVLEVVVVGMGITVLMQCCALRVEGCVAGRSQHHARCQRPGVGNAHDAVTGKGYSS